MTTPLLIPDADQADAFDVWHGNQLAGECWLQRDGQWRWARSWFAGSGLPFRTGHADNLADCIAAIISTR